MILTATERKLYKIYYDLISYKIYLNYENVILNLISKAYYI